MNQTQIPNMIAAGIAIRKIRILPDRIWMMLILFCISIYILAVVQDLVFAKLYRTRFYWSETLLYNLYWFLFPPLLLFLHRLVSPKKFRSPLFKGLYYVISGCLFPIIHIFLFALIFVGLSTLMNDNPHRMSVILSSAFSNQLYITVLVYIFLPWVYPYIIGLKRPLHSLGARFPSGTLAIKQGSRTRMIAIHTISSILTDKPYSAFFVNCEKILHNESLKKLEESLDPEIFIRVHRSAIINKGHIRQFRSRGNGDYDVDLSDGRTIRLSRHYRSNWEGLILHSV